MTIRWRIFAVGLMMACISSLAAATSDEQEVGDFADLDLEELLDVVFSAAKHEQDIAESPSAVTVISREQIENTYCTDVVCLLRQVPEVDVLLLKPLYAAVGARALSDELGNKTLVLVDGQEINVEAMGFSMWQALPVHLEDIERIEIIRGPGSALYGANAHSMVVSMTTRKSDKPVELYLGAGGYNRNSLHLRLNQRLGDWHLHLSGGEDTASWWKNPKKLQREVRRIRLAVDHQSGDNISSLQLGLTTAEGWLYSMLGAGNIKDVYLGNILLLHQRKHLRAQAWYTCYTGTIPVGTSLQYGGFDLGKLADEVPFFTSTLDAELQTNFSPFQDNLLIAAGNFRWIRFNSDEAQPGQVDQFRLGLFVNDEQRLGDTLVLTGSLRFDYNNITPITFSPRLAGVWRFADQQHLRLAFGQAFRKPAFFDTSFHLKNVRAEPGFEEIEDFFLGSIGNERLDNESVTAFEIGYTGRFLESRLTLEADLFYNRYRDTINFYVNIATNQLGMPDIPRSTAKFLNQGREVDSLGGSLSATLRIKKVLRLSGNYTFRHSWYISDAHLDSSGASATKGDRVPWEPAHLANFMFYLLDPSGLRLGAGVHWKSSCTWSIIEEGIFGPTFLLRTPASWFLNGFLTMKFDMGTSDLELGLKVTNLLNHPYHDMSHMQASDGDQIGGDPLLRRVFLFVRGSL